MIDMMDMIDSIDEHINFSVFQDIIDTVGHT